MCRSYPIITLSVQTLNFNRTIMKKYICILALLFPLSLLAAPKKGPKSEIKVASYNLTASAQRAQDVKKEKAPVQRLWSNSVGAVADQIVSMDCDVVGLLDVCDSIAGRKGDAGLPKALETRGADYSWMILSNTRPSLPYEGAYYKTQAIIWKTSKYNCLDWGINWLGGFFDKNRIAGDLKGDAAKSVTWAKFREKSTGKEFYFMVATVNGASNEALNVCNCRNLIKIADEKIVTDARPSIIVGSFNMQDNTPGYTECLGVSKWVDVYARMKSDGMLMPSELEIKHTRNNTQGTKPSSGRPDYIFVDGFGIDAYNVSREKFPASDDTLVYPSYGFPLISTLTF